MAEEPTYYDDLGVKQDATPEEIKKAYKRKASKLHPDRDGGDEDAFKRVQRAYMVLSNKKKKNRYDSGEDEQHTPTARDQALQNLSVLFASIISNNIQMIEYVNIIETITHNIETNRAEPKRQIAKARKRLDKVNDAISRLKKKNPDEALDLFGSVLQQEVTSCNHAIETAEEQLEIMRIMTEMANGYEYNYDQRDKGSHERDLRDIANKFRAAGHSGLFPDGLSGTSTGS